MQRAPVQTPIFIVLIPCYIKPMAWIVCGNRPTVGLCLPENPSLAYEIPPAQLSPVGQQQEYISGSNNAVPAEIGRAILAIGARPPGAKQPENIRCTDLALAVGQ